MFCTTFMSLFSLLFSLAVLGSLFRQGKAAEYYVFWLTIQRFIESNCMCTQQYCSLSLPMPPTFLHLSYFQGKLPSFSSSQQET